MLKIWLDVYCCHWLSFRLKTFLYNIMSLSQIWARQGPQRKTFNLLTTVWPKHMIHSVKLSPPSWCQIVLSNFLVSNCPFLTLGVKLSAFNSWCQVVQGPIVLQSLIGHMSFLSVWPLHLWRQPLCKFCLERLVLQNVIFVSGVFRLISIDLKCPVALSLRGSNAMPL